MSVCVAFVAGVGEWTAVALKFLCVVLFVRSSLHFVFMFFFTTNSCQDTHCMLAYNYKMSS